MKTPPRYRIGRSAMPCCLALSVILMLTAPSPAPAAAAPETGALLQAGDFMVSGRSFARVYAILRGTTSTPGDLDRKVKDRLEQERRDLLLAVAAKREGLDKDPDVLRELESYRMEHLKDLYVQKMVKEPAQALVKERTAEKPGINAKKAFKSETDRIFATVRKEAAGRVTVKIDEEALAAGVEGTGKNPVVAWVDGKAIFFDELRPGIAAVRHPTAGRETETAVALSVLKLVTASRSLSRAAEKDGYDNAEFKDDVRERTIRILAREYLRRKVHPAVTITPEAVRAYYDRNADSLQRGVEKEIYEVMVKDPAKAEEILARLRRGSAFDEEVRNHSLGATKDKGGRLGYIQEGDLIEPLDEAAKGLAPGQTSGVVKTKFGYHILQCAAQVENRVPSFDEVAFKIERRLLEEAKAQAEEKARRELEKTIPVKFDEKLFKEIRGGS